MCAAAAAISMCRRAHVYTLLGWLLWLYRRSEGPVTTRYLTLNLFQSHNYAPRAATVVGTCPVVVVVVFRMLHVHDHDQTRWCVEIFRDELWKRISSAMIVWKNLRVQHGRECIGRRGMRPVRYVENLQNRGNCPACWWCLWYDVSVFKNKKGNIRMKR